MPPILVLICCLWLKVASCYNYNATIVIKDDFSRRWLERSHFCKNGVHACSQSKMIFFVSSKMPNFRIYEGPHRRVLNILEALTSVGHKVIMYPMEKTHPSASSESSRSLKRMGINVQSLMTEKNSQLSQVNS